MKPYTPWRQTLAWIGFATLITAVVLGIRIIIGI